MELIIEQNYKDLYDQAISRAKQHCSDYIVETIFPDLKESKDNRIRKALINQFNDYKRRGENHGFGYSNDEILDYLKRQGEQKPVISDDALREGITHFGITQYQIDNWLKKYINVEKQGEHESEDKVEPKFKVGDWIIGRTTDNEPRQIAEITEEGYKTTYGGWIGFSFEEDTRLWTIQDAKDGDVLATLAGAFIYNGNNGGGSCPGSYCGINTLGKFQTGVEHHWTGKKVYPATKEQRDQLEKAMADAGYTFDFEKKELKKIEQKTSCGEEDENYSKSCITRIKMIDSDATLKWLLFD